MVMEENSSLAFLKLLDWFGSDDLRLKEHRTFEDTPSLTAKI
jgi:hypothetical protein